MSDTSLLALILALLLFISGTVLFVRYFPWRIKLKPLYMTVVLDAADYKSYDAVIQILSNYDLMDADYFDNGDIVRLQIGVEKSDYEPVFKSISAMQNVEVI